MKWLRLFVLGLVLGSGSSLWGFSKSMYPYAVPGGALGASMGCVQAVSGMKLETGVWYTNYSVCKAYADREGIPLLAVWSNHGCIHCWYTDVVFQQETFKEWQATHDAGQVICCFMAGGDDTLDQVGSSAYRWMWTGGTSTLSSYPFVALWWKKGGVNIHLTGDDLCRGEAKNILSFTDSSLPQRVQNVTAAMAKAFAGWRASVPEALGVFALTNATGAASIWATPNQASLPVAVVRDSTTATNQLLVVRQRGEEVGRQTVDWARGVVDQVVQVADFGEKYYEEGTFVQLQLLDGDGETVRSETVVACAEQPLNDNYDTTAAISLAGLVEGRLSPADPMDVYRVAGGAIGNLLSCRVVGAVTGKVQVELVEVLTGCTNVLARADGDLKNGVAIEARIPSDACFLRVTGEGEWSTAGKTVRTYSIESGIVLVPDETRRMYFLDESESAVRMELADDTCYRLQGLLPQAGVLELSSEGRPYYWAQADGRFLLSAEFPGAVLVYQVWKPGMVGFASASASVSESAGRVAIPVTRVGGSSGRVVVRVALDHEVSTLKDSAGNLRCVNFPEATFIWEDGEAGSTNVWVRLVDDKVFEGSGELVFRLESTRGSALVGVDTFRLQVQDDEKARPGEVWLEGEARGLGKNRSLVVRAGAGADLVVRRGGWAEGEAAVGVSTTPKTVELEGLNAEGRLVWQHHEVEAKPLRVRGLAAGDSVRISLTAPSTGLSVVSASNAVTVVAVADDAPAFVQDIHEATLYRSVACSNVYPVVLAAGGKVAFTKQNGVLPPGLKVGVDALTGAMVVSGTPTTAGSYVCTYQVKAGTRTGLIGEFRFTVVDPTDAKRFPELANPSVATSRTFNDIPVVQVATGELLGLLQVTVPPKGNVSAKYQCASGTVSFTSKAWTEFEPGTRTLRTELVAGKRGYWMQVECTADSAVGIAMVDPAAGPEALTTLVDGSVRWGTANSAKAWGADYTVALPVEGSAILENLSGLAPRGAGYLTLKMSTASAWNAGKVTWAGVLPNGVSMSGSAVLTAKGPLAYLPIFKVGSNDRIAAYLELADAEGGGGVRLADGMVAKLRHAVKGNGGALDYEVELSPLGGRWSASSAIMGILGTETPELTFRCSDLESTNVDLALVDWTLPLVAGASTLGVAKGAPTGCSLRLNRQTGVVSGSVRLPCNQAGKSVTATWQGVLLTGMAPDGVQGLVGGAVFTDRVLPPGVRNPISIKRSLGVESH